MLSTLSSWFHLVFLMSSRNGFYCDPIFQKENLRFRGLMTCPQDERSHLHPAQCVFWSQSFIPQDLGLSSSIFGNPQFHSCLLTWLPGSSLHSLSSLFCFLCHQFLVPNPHPNQTVCSSPLLSHDHPFSYLLFFPGKVLPAPPHPLGIHLSKSTHSSRSISDATPSWNTQYVTAFTWGLCFYLWFALPTAGLKCFHQSPPPDAQVNSLPLHGLQGARVVSLNSYFVFQIGKNFLSYSINNPCLFWYENNVIFQNH